LGILFFGIIVLIIMAFIFYVRNIEKLMAMIFIHGRWRWNFSCIKRIYGRLPHENDYHMKLNLEILFLKETFLNTIIHEEGQIGEHGTILLNIVDFSMHHVACV
jgi:hypothetical protein